MLPINFYFTKVKLQIVKTNLTVLRSPLLLLSFLFGQILFAQKKNEKYQLHIKKASSSIQVDGSMDEQAWKEAEVVTNFFMVLPMDTSFAKVNTEVRMSYDGENLYLMATCF